MGYAGLAFLKRRDRTYLSLLLITLLMLPLFGGPAQVSAADSDRVRISEIRIDQPGSDYDEYFELVGEPGASLDGLTYLVIGDGTGGSGVIEAVVDLAGQSVPSSGYFVAAESSFSLAVADFTTSLNFENSDNVTHLLVSGFTGANGNDLDTNDDGVLDSTPWSSIIDSVALVETDGAGDLLYSSNRVGPDGFFVPGHVYRCIDEWVIGAFSGGNDSPGAPAAGCVRISEIRIDQPSTDNDEYLELVGNPGLPLDGLTYLVIGDGTGGSGVIEAVVDLSGQSIPSGGYFVAAEGTFSIGTADLTTNLNFENSDNVTHLLVSAFSGANGDDLDTDDDGVLDTTPWNEVVDSIALVETVGSGEQIYSANTIGPDGSFVPGHVFECAGLWSIGPFGGGQDTPGAANFSCVVTGPDMPPTVTSVVPADGATRVDPGTSLTVSFSEDVTATGDWFAITCNGAPVAATVSGGPSVYSLNPDSSLPQEADCEVTITAANISDQDAPISTMASDYTWAFVTGVPFGVCGDGHETRIHEVQGSGSASPLDGKAVVVEGVVTADFQLSSEFRGFYLQEEDAHRDVNGLTSEGIFVYDSSDEVNVGDVVRVSALVDEFFDLTELTSVDNLVVCGTGALTSVTPVSLGVPLVAGVEWEHFEGMWVNFPQTLTVTETYNLGRYGELMLADERLYQFTHLNTPSVAGNEAYAADVARRSIILDDGSNVQNVDPILYPHEDLSASNTLRVGDTVSYVQGVLGYSFGAYRMQPTDPASMVFHPTNPRVATPAPIGGRVQVASFNVLNYFNGPDFPTSRGADTALEFARQRDKIISAIVALDADVVGLMEIENDADAPGSAIEDLVSGLNAALGADVYSYIDTGLIGTDAIAVGLIYQSAAVTPVGPYAVLDSSVDPRFVDTKNRPALAQTFMENVSGEPFTVIVNHLKSKGSDCNDLGDPDLGDGQGNCNITRTNAALAMINWLATDPTGSGDTDFLIIGDLNSYAMEDPISALVNGGFTNLVSQFGGPEAYTYVFSGQSGNLDHALSSEDLTVQVVGTEVWHINTDEPSVLDYDMTYKSDNQDEILYDAGPFRASDHDPILLGLDLIVTVQVDIKPDGEPNSINLDSQGNIPVAILSTPYFDAPLHVDPATLTLAGAPVLRRGKQERLMVSTEDVNDDGLLDLMLHFDTTKLNLTGADTEAVLEGLTYEGWQIHGSDSVRIVKERTCAATAGYWLAHSELGPEAYDTTWLSVGPSGANEEFLHGLTYGQVLWAPAGTSSWIALAQHVIAVELNSEAGITWSESTEDSLTLARSLLSSSGPEDRVTRNKRAVFNQLARVFEREINSLAVCD